MKVNIIIDDLKGSGRMCLAEKKGSVNEKRKQTFIARTRTISAIAQQNAR